MAVEQSSDFLVTPNAGLMALSLLLMAIAICGLITALKGRLGWLAVGLFLTGGLVWLITAFLVAVPRSPWARLFYGDEKLRAANAHFTASS